MLSFKVARTSFLAREVDHHRASRSPLSLKANVRKKHNCCAFPFSDAKSYGLKNKTWGHRFNSLVISDISEKSGLENPFGMLPW